ncbi:uncharacterized protein LOC112563549 isoform X6 [Pomacea canaliculata]|uniref:uncharacterized protein LOC112563549 isoform X6 n=1 Tax=Pomacea canaliculata TaxID=400727 RepID=UPI000D725D59|nr:uncharacterized protein LOC112563549 isoform X6 [Pomacea canaliculata]
MGRKLNLSHLTEEECEKILSVLQRDFEVRQKEKDRIGLVESVLNAEKNRTAVLSQQTMFNKSCCIRCCQVFGFIFNRRHQCFACGYNVCKDCCNYVAENKTYICVVCAREKDLKQKACGWFYNTVSQRFRRFGSAKVVRSLYKSTSYCKLRYALNQARSMRHKLTSDTEVERGYEPSIFSSMESRSVKRRPRLADVFDIDNDDDDDEYDGGEEDDDVDDSENKLPPQSTSVRTPAISTSNRRLGSTRAGSVETLNLLSSSSSSSHQRSRTPDFLKPLSKETEIYKSNHKARETKGFHQKAFDSARKAEEYKFRIKFDSLLNELRHALDKKSPQGLSNSFASVSSDGEVMLSFRARLKEILIGFSKRLHLAFESFEKDDPKAERVQQVKQNISRFLEDVLGESLDLTSDEAVSDLSSLSDESTNERHSFEDQIAQAVVSKIVENHRKEVSHSLKFSHRLDGHLSSPSLVPDTRDSEEEEGEVEEEASPPTDRQARNIDITKDFEDLKHFVEETQSRTVQQSLETDGEVRSGESGYSSQSHSSSLEPLSNGKDHYLQDFSDLEQIDFNSGETDPDLLSMNLAIIPEETEEELERDAADISDKHWRENWIFKNTAPSAYDNIGQRRIKGGSETPQYMMVPQPDHRLMPKVGNRDVDQLSELSDFDDHILCSDDLTDDDSFYPRTSEELERLSRRSFSTRAGAGDSFVDTARHRTRTETPPFSDDLDFEDVGVGTDDFVGPIVEPTKQELKLLEELVPAENDDPRFTLVPESVVIQEGEPVKFSCRVSGTQPVDVFWYREQEEVEELEESEDVELVVDGDRHSATLYNVSRAQAGQYMCIALSDRGKAIKYLTVTVKDNKQDLKKPEFLKQITDMEVTEGHSVRFRCKVKGYPQPRISWYKDGILLKNSKSCRIEKFGNRDYILTIDYATMDDDAEYMVVARNVAGEAKSSAQVIVEPFSGDAPPIRSRGRVLSSNTSAADSDSDTPSSAQQLRRGELKLDTLAQKVAVARENMREEAESMLVTAEELTALSQHLDDMERHLDSIENVAHPYNPHPPHKQPSNNVGSSHFLEEAVDLDIIENEIAMKETAKQVRLITSNALSVLRTAQETIESEKSFSQEYSTSTPRLQNRKSGMVGQDGDNNNNKSSSPVFASLSLTETDSKAIDINSMLPDNLDEPSFDSFRTTSEYTPVVSGSYREEVSLSLSSVSNKNINDPLPPSAFSDAQKVCATEVKAQKAVVDDVFGRETDSSRTSNHSSMPTADNSMRSMREKLTLTDESSVTVPTDEVDSRLAMSDFSLASPESDSKLIVNFGPKETNREWYSRDYEVSSVKPAAETTARKRWSVTLDPYCPTAEVVNRQSSLEETEEKIYLTAGHMYGLEDRVRELEGRLEGEGRRGPVHSLSDLEAQVVKAAVQVTRSEKEVNSIVNAVSLLQTSPRSSRGSSSSTASTPRESIDSGTSLTSERPQPLHLVGQTREDDIPESRAEFDADSGVELPSVSRLRAMFSPNRKEDDFVDGNFNRSPQADDENCVCMRLDDIFTCVLTP